MLEIATGGLPGLLQTNSLRTRPGSSMSTQSSSLVQRILSKDAVAWRKHILTFQQPHKVPFQPFLELCLLSAHALFRDCCVCRIHPHLSSPVDQLRQRQLLRLWVQCDSLNSIPHTGWIGWAGWILFASRTITLTRPKVEWSTEAC